MTLPDLAALLTGAGGRPHPEQVGRVARLRGLAVEATGLRAALGELCRLQTAEGVIPAEVVGFGDGLVMLMPIGEIAGIVAGDAVVSTGRPLTVRTGAATLGRVLDGLGRPMDGLGPILGVERVVSATGPSALARTPIHETVETGISAIDGFLTCGQGQRIGIFAGSGVGKSTLLGNMARDSSADVNVIALVGERGREVNEFLVDVLGQEGLARSVLVVATSDAAPLLRYKAVFTAVTLAESFRDEGKHVLFMMDSVTRFAAAAREIGLAAGEPPTLRGYPPSFFATLPRVVERLGCAAQGCITGLLTVLVEGDDFNEPVSDTVRGLLDGHIVLDRRIAARGSFPAIDVLASVSRLMPRLVDAEQLARVRELRALLAAYEESRDLIQVGAYQAGADARLDQAIALVPEIESLLYQGHERRSFDVTADRIRQLAQAMAHAAPLHMPMNSTGIPTGMVR